MLKLECKMLYEYASAPHALMFGDELVWIAAS